MSDSRLRAYIRASQRGGFGWKADYDHALMGEQWGHAWLAGHYAGMLDDLLALVGKDAALLLLDGADALTERVMLASGVGERANKEDGT